MAQNPKNTTVSSAKQERHKGASYGTPHKGVGKQKSHRRNRRVARELSRTMRVEG